MKRTIKILKAQRLWGRVAKDRMIYDISDVLINLPLTATKKDIENYINKYDESNND